MKILTAGVLSAILVAGIAGAFAGYRSQTNQDLPSQRPVAVAATHVAKAAHHQRPRVRWAPCRKGSKLEGRVCVTDVVKTVVVPAAPVYVTAPATSGGSRSSEATRTASHAEHEPSDDGGGDRGEGGGDDGGRGGGGEDHEGGGD
jgi:hypothetical protein